MVFNEFSADRLSRLKKVYNYLFIGMTLTIVFIFFEPTIRRLTEGIWTRGKYIYAWTLSLDLHAIFAFALLALFVGQLFLGYRQTKQSNCRRFHARQGYFLFYVALPALVLTNVWLIFDRAFNIPAEESILFARNPTVILVGLMELLTFIVWYGIRAFRAIRKGDVATHIDSILGLYIMMGDIAMIRLLYLIFWSTSGSSPFSIVGMYFLSMGVNIVLLAGAYFLADRFQQNKLSLLMIIIATLLLAILGSGHYTIMHVPNL